MLPVVYPLLALLVGGVGTLAMNYLVAAFERQRARDTFSRFVPADVVDQLLADSGGEVRLGGVRRECTMLFSDIRGFTTYAETTPADEVVEVLNRYLGEMTDAMMDNGGTLVSYIGDGIIAVFGAPVEQADHADRAIAAAREMLDVRLPRFNDWMAESGHGEGFRIGIGLNSGEVMSGQVGLRAADGVHDDRRHGKHRGPARGDDEGHRAPGVHLRLHPRRAPAAAGRPGARRRPGGAGAGGRDPRLVARPTSPSGPPGTRTASRFRIDSPDER